MVFPDSSSVPDAFFSLQIWAFKQGGICSVIWIPQRSDQKSDRSVRKSDQKVTERVPKRKKSDRTPFADLLLRHPDLQILVLKKHI